MLLIQCPHCGPRNSDEFVFKGEVVTRPDVSVTPALWRAYLYDKANVAGWQAETWFHVSGCRRFLRVERNTVSNEIGAVHDVTENP